MRQVSVGSVSDFPESGRLAFDIGGIEVGIFRLDDGFVAYLNSCAHMGGPVCLGKIIPRVEEVFGATRPARVSVFEGSQEHSVPVAWL